MVTVTRRQMEGLEQLVEPARLTRAIEDYQKCSEWYMTFDQFEELANNAAGLSKKFASNRTNLMNKIGSVSEVRTLGLCWYRLIKLGFESDVEKTMETCVKVQNNWEKHFAESDKLFGRTVKKAENKGFVRGGDGSMFIGKYVSIRQSEIPDAILNASHIAPDEKRLAMASWIKDASLVERMMFAQYIAKLNRFRALHSADPGIARYYVTLICDQIYDKLKRLAEDFENLSGIDAARKLRGIREQESIDLALHPDEIVAYIGIDRDQYKESLANISVRASKPATRTANEEELTYIPEPVRESQTSQSILMSSIIQNNHLGSEKFSAAVAKRTDYFVQDAISYGLSESQLELLGRSFARLKLDKKVRHGATEIQIRTFFDDVTLQYLRKGAVPQPDDLEKLYASVQKEFPSIAKAA